LFLPFGLIHELKGKRNLKSVCNLSPFSFLLKGADLIR